MKVKVKQMDEQGNKYLVYLSTYDDVLIKADITSKDELDESLLKYRAYDCAITFEKFNYEEYLGQDERN